MSLFRNGLSQYPYWFVRQTFSLPAMSKSRNISKVESVRRVTADWNSSCTEVVQHSGSEINPMFTGKSLLRLLLALGACLPLAGMSWAPHINTSTSAHPQTKSKTPPRKISETQRTRRRMRHLARSRSANLTHVSVSTRRRRSYERFYMSSFAEGIAAGDLTAGEDPVVRQAAIDALGNMNGTVVAIEPTSGRVLAMVNQKLALSSGAQPCSTIKLSVALAALSEGLIDKGTEVSLGSRNRMNLTEALAHSNNAYFEAVGRKLGFEKVHYYAQQFGLGELAGYHIPGEQLGTYPEEEISAKLGGVSKMCSFGEGISMTPLQLGALITAISNGGTLYYLQHPTDPEAVANSEPRVKRHLHVDNVIPELS